MRIWHKILLLLIVLLLPVTVLAQGEARLNSAVVQLWPEFDRAEMLVMIQLSLNSTTTLPMDLDISIPASAAIHKVAVGETKDAVSDQDVMYETRTGDGQTTLTIRNVNGRAIRIEYYDDLGMQGVNRTYAYVWPGNMATEILTIIFQQPVDASVPVLQPSADDIMTDSNGLNYYTITYYTLSKGEAASLDVTYQKTSNRLSASIPEVQPLEPVNGDAQGRISFAIYLPWLIGVAGFLLILIGLGFGLSYWRGKGRIIFPRWRSSTAGAEKEASRIMLNCSECGHRLQPGDKFCRACGSRVKNDN
jgi:hypothetical protein